MATEFELTTSEKLKIYRKRNNISQRRLAEQLGVCRTVIQKIENGEKEIQTPPDIEPTKLEIAWLLRMRKGLSQEKLAEMIRTDRVSIIAMEKGKKDATSLINFLGIV